MPPGGRRGSVRGFSRKSRLSMLEAVHAIDRQAVLCTFFLTLTVPRGEAGWVEIETFRENWLKRFERRWGRDRCFVVWKKELHKSGTPHLHALCFWVADPPRLDEFRPWNDDAWADTVKSPHPDHRRVACKVERMASWNGVASYSAKYLAKDQDGLLEDTGRIWGTWNKQLRNAKALKSQLHHLPSIAGKKFRRVLRRLQSRRRESWWVFTDGKWHKLRPVKGGASLSDQVAQAKAAGLRVKRRRPRCCMTIGRKVWAEVTTTSMALGREVKTIEPTDEVFYWSYTSALHFVLAETANRLALWSVGEWVDQLEAEQDLPF